MTSRPTDVAATAAEVIGAHDVAVVLGSGWADVATALGEPVASWDMPSLAGFRPPSVAGHPGTVRSLAAPNGARVLALAGRTHLYEGFGIEPVVHGVEVAAAAGCAVVVLTNAAGAVNGSYAVGQPVLIADHLNLTGRTPLVGPRFVDLTDCWSARLRELALSADPTLAQGVYAGLSGPQYETPAEIRMLRGLGADLVGMSTVLEVIAARSLGLEVLGLSLVTNMAAGVSAGGLDHREVLAAGQASAGRLGELVASFVGRLTA